METLRQYFNNQLSGIYTINEIGSLYRLFVSKVCDIPEVKCYNYKDTNFTQTQTEKLIKIANRLAKNEPWQYILEHIEFDGLNLMVNKNVLIPRPETAELVEYVLTMGIENVGSIIDIGTGSGYIAIALAKHFKEASVYAIDAFDAVLNVAQHNAKANNVDINFMKMDFLSDKKDSLKKFDIIISNPPYIGESEKPLMQANVLDYEPSTALFVPDSNPTIFYDEIANFAASHLNKDGYVFVEINQKFGTETLKCFTSLGFKAEVIKDLSQNDRFIKATF